MKILISEWIKTKRTPIRWFAFFTPIIFATFIIWYFSLKPISKNTQLSIFEAFFEVWASLVIPLSTGLISGLIIHQEELAGSFNGLLGSKLPRSNLYIGKLVLIILLTLASTLLAVLTLLVGSSFALNIQITWSIFIISAIMVIIGTLPLIVFHLWISFAWGMGASIAIGGIGALIAALMATGLGDIIWKYVPWAWPIRLTELTGMYLFCMKYPSEIISSGFIVDQVTKGLITVAVIFTSLLFGGLIWFNRWEGRKISD